MMQGNQGDVPPDEEGLGVVQELGPYQKTG
jgi:hypothetical protein